MSLQGAVDRTQGKFDVSSEGDSQWRLNGGTYWIHTNIQPKNFSIRRYLDTHLH